MNLAQISDFYVTKHVTKSSARNGSNKIKHIEYLLKNPSSDKVVVQIEFTCRPDNTINLDIWIDKIRALESENPKIVEEWRERYPRLARAALFYCLFDLAMDCPYDAASADLTLQAVGGEMRMKPFKGWSEKQMRTFKTERLVTQVYLPMGFTPSHPEYSYEKGTVPMKGSIRRILEFLRPSALLHKATTESGKLIKV